MLRKSWLPQRLLGERITLRPIREADAETIVVLVARYPDVVRRFAFFTVPRTVDDEKTYLCAMIESPADAIFAIEEKTSGMLVGTVGLHEIDRRNDNARLGYILFDAAAHGQGLMREAIRLFLSWAFTELGLHKVYLQVFTENREGIRTDIALGFSFEGRIREHYKVGGRYYDLYHLSILKGEWENQQ